MLLDPWVLSEDLVCLVPVVILVLPVLPEKEEFQDLLDLRERWDLSENLVHQVPMG